MNKKLQKAVSLVLTLVFVLSSFSLLSVNATATELDGNLVLHYDFEGNTVSEALSDKATSGSISDNLTPTAGEGVFTGLTFDLVNGTVKNTEAGYGLKAAQSDDTALVSNASTWFVRAKMERLDAITVYELVDMNSTKRRPYNLIYQLSDVNTGRRFGTSLSDGTTTINGYFDYIYDFTADVYINLATVLTLTGDETYPYAVSLYYALGTPQSASEWTLIRTANYKANAVPQTTEILYLLSTGKSGAAGLTLDDVRLYNKALSVEEISTIIPTGSFDSHSSDSTTAQLYGIQFSNTEGANYNARFVGAINSLEGFSSVGYEIVLSNGIDAKKFTLEGTTVYTSILASETSGITQTVSAKDIGSNYIIALTITEIPDDYASYMVKTFVISDGIKTYSDIVTVGRPSTWNQ